MFFTSALPLHLNLSMCFSELAMPRVMPFSLEVLYKIADNSNSILYQKQS